MAKTETTPTANAPAAQLEGQTYEIIRGRLAHEGNELRERLARLNESRKAVFGSIETKLLGTERVTTANNCQPRDMIAIGGRFLFGYNVHVGLRTETVLEDVFSVFRFEDHAFHADTLALIENEQFRNDFRELYTYYKNTRFAKFAKIGPYLFMVFRVGKQVGDIKTFKWLIDGDQLKYVGNRSDHEYQFPPQHEFEWKRATRDMQVAGLHPHISIDERVFVETMGGDLTIKIENNTDSGEGIFSEPVDNPDQTLDDAEVYFAIVGNLILIKVRPYQETAFRYIVYSEKVQSARRIDAIADACVLLPDGHGLIFSRGYYLQTGEYKTFDMPLADMVFEKQIRSPNGEDYLYVFFNRLDGVYVLLSYNVISQEVSTPTICSGYATFDSGEMLAFRHNDEAQKHHAIQIWRTPYTAEQFVRQAETDSILYKIGNKDLVRGMAECHEILNLIAKEDSYANLYLDITKRATDILDSYFWINEPEAESLGEVLAGVRDAAQAAISEFDKVARVRRATADELARVRKKTDATFSHVKLARYESIDDFVTTLSELRTVRGEIVSLRDLRYVDLTIVDKLEADVAKASERLANSCVEFLLRPDALAPYEQRVATAEARIATLEKVADAKALGEEVDAAASELEMLIEIVSNLKIDDATQRTAIIDNISTIFAGLNKTRAGLKNKTQSLASTEGAAEFASQLKLLNQAVVNYLDICDSPEKCEEYLTKLMIQVEELEARFAEFDAMIEELGQKREEIYNAFESRRLQLVEAKNRRAATLMKSADRILSGIDSRAKSIKSVDEIHGYFASDLMVDKVRDIMDQLDKLGDSVKVGDIQSRLKTIGEDAIRQLKDRQDLYVDGQNVIQFGKHKFAVNVQALDLTTVPRDGEMSFHLTGTNFFEAIDDEAFLATRPVWEQEVVSENAVVYRAEYLAFSMLQKPDAEWLRAISSPAAASSRAAGASDDAAVLDAVQKYMAPRYAEGYVKGVHDADGAKILSALIEMTATIGLLRYSSRARALAWLFWNTWENDRKSVLAARLAGFGKITSLFPETKTQAACVAELQAHIAEKAPDAFANEAGEYLFHALAGEETFAISGDAAALCQAFREFLHAKAYDDSFTISLGALDANRIAQFQLARDWVGAYLDEIDADAEHRALQDEVAQLLVEGDYDASRVIGASTYRDLEGLVGSHPRIQNGQMRLSYNEFAARLSQYVREVVPAFEQYQSLKRKLVDARRDELKLEEFKPRVLTSFVRNQLIDRVYLPMIGDNLAKQIGTVGDTTRTDRMGLLLLISPPGYGKTTLMEYLANRLGIIFMKVNGPAIGHRVTSLDPSEAPNAAAREEMEKLNLALEMGDNVMLYLDDIQHVSAELLQKFISLCDATRKIEGVWKGETRTYDLRGKKVCVVMAGNPYTESGERFQIPDMLANRADTYNLGEMIGDSEAVFEMSYLENAMTSNPTLAPIASRNPGDIVKLIQMAETGAVETGDLAGGYSLDELNELLDVMRKLIRVRDVILAVNREYIRSAGQSDDYRTEPAFKLQGSYRNMNRIAERVSPVMNEAELDALILSQYEQDSQTLTTGAEANMLKFKELIGKLSDNEAKRWASIKQTFQQNVKLRGVEEGDKFGQVIARMGVVSDGLSAIRDAVAAGTSEIEKANAREAESERSAAADWYATIGDQLASFQNGLASIQQTLAGGVEKLAAIEKKAPSTRRKKPDPLQATFAPEAMEILTKFIAELQLASAEKSTAAGAKTLTATTANGGTSTAVTPSGEPYKVEVINRVPRAFLSIIREQFKLMQAWMEPLMQATHQNSQGMKELQQQLDAAMKEYERLSEKLDEEE